MKTPNRLFRTAAARGSVAVLVLASALSARAADPSTFERANDLYEHGKYAEAKAAYEDLARTGPLSANVFYNLGNAEWKLGDAGQAAVNYERALALQPSLAPARANLGYVRDQTGARVAVPNWWQEALQELDATAASILAAVCGWVFLFCLIALFLRRGVKMAGVRAAMVASLLIGAYAGGSLWRAAQNERRAIVIATTTTARVAPSEVVPAADTLPAGSEVFAPEERGAWTYCTLPNGARAWVATPALARVVSAHS